MSEARVISKDLPYADVAGKSMRVKNFTQLSSYKDGIVKSNSATTPHGLMEVRLDGFGENPILPIVHTLDYKNACELWEAVKENEEEYILWVTVVSMKGLARLIAWTQPRLEFNLWDRSIGEIIEIRRGLLRGDEALSSG